MPMATTTPPLLSGPEFIPVIVVLVMADIMVVVMAAVGVAAMVDIADARPASRGLSASFGKTLKKRASL